MSARLDAVREADVVIVGAGVAGLSVALGLAGRRVDLLAKGPLGQTGNSPLAQGGIAAAVGPGDSPALPRRRHARPWRARSPTPAPWRCLTSDGPQRLAELIALGTRFDRDAAGQLDLGREAAHSRSASCTPATRTGAEVVRALGQALRERGGLSRVRALRRRSRSCIDAGRVAGVLARHQDGAPRAAPLARRGAGDRRHRPPLRAHDQPGRGDRRRARARLAGRRAARRPRVRAVPSDGARHAAPTRCRS